MNRFIAKKVLKPFSIIGFAALSAGQAHAACSLYDNNPVQHPVILANPIVVKPSTSPGTPLGTYANVGSPVWLLDCGGSATAVRFSGQFYTGASSVPDVYTTPIPGIGFKVTYKGRELRGNRFVLPYIEDIVIPSAGSAEDRAGDVIVDVVRIPGDLKAGRYSGGEEIARINVFTSFGNQRYRTITIGNIVIQVPTCSLTAGSLRQTVDLGTWASKDFPAVGSGSAWKDFEFESQECDTSQFSRVKMTFSGAVDSTNLNLFRLNSGGGSGVGIEVQTDTGARVAPNATADLPTLSAGGKYRFKARYTRTTAPFGGGAANATATVTVNYE